MAGLILYICVSVFFGISLALWIITFFMLKTNRFDEQSNEFYNNTKRPLRLGNFDSKDGRGRNHYDI